MAKPSRSQRKTSGASRKPSRAQAAATKKPKAKVPIEQIAEAKPRKLASSWRLSRRTLGLLWRQRRFFGLMLAVYALLDLLLVRSVTVFNVDTIRSSLGSPVQHGIGQLTGGFGVFSVLFSSAATGASADATGAYHFMIITLVSLATIWALRQMFTQKKSGSVSLKLAFYNGVAPLIPSLLLLLLLLLQLVPVLIGNSLLSLAVQGGIAKTVFEQVLFIAAVIGLLALTLYWISRTVIALYAVTLPGMLPLDAYRQSKDIVKGHRLSIIRKLLFLPLAFFVCAGLVTIPAIIIWAPLAQWLFFAMSLAGLLVAQTYLFTLYRELVDD